MRVIYPILDDPQLPTAASRADRTLIARSALSDLVSQFGDSIFDAPEPLVIRERKRTRSKYKSTRYVLSEDDTDDEEDPFAEGNKEGQ